MNSILEKGFIAALCVLAIWWFTYDWISQELPSLAPEPPPVRETVVAVPKKKAPPVAVVKVEPTIPEGVFFPKTYYTRERVTVTTESGVQSIGKGTRVDAVPQDDGRFLIRHGKAELIVSAEQITCDAGEIREVTR